MKFSYGGLKIMLYVQIIKLLFNKLILRKNNGIVIKDFSEKMGVVFIS